MAHRTPIGRLTLGDTVSRPAAAGVDQNRYHVTPVRTVHWPERALYRACEHLRGIVKGSYGSGLARLSVEVVIGPCGQARYTSHVTLSYRSLRMPTYEYECQSCHLRTEAVQTFTDPALTTCATCGGELRKVFSAVGIVFKGSGFYKNDSRGSSQTTTPSSTSPTPTSAPEAASTPAPTPAPSTNSTSSSTTKSAD